MQCQQGVPINDLTSTYSSQVSHTLGESGLYLVGHAIEVEDHLWELGPMMLLPDFLLGVDIVAILRRQASR
jgi:hypothetical protein